MMYGVTIIVLASACVNNAQFQIPLFSQFIPSRSPVTGRGIHLFQHQQPPSPSSQTHKIFALQPSASQQRPRSIIHLEGLTAPPPPNIFEASPKIRNSHLHDFDLTDFKRQKDRRTDILGISPVEVPEKGRDTITDDSTSKPSLVGTPTTIRFTLDDVPDFLEPSLFPTQSDTNSLPFESIVGQRSPIEEEDINRVVDVKDENGQQHLFILSSSTKLPDVTSTWKPSSSSISSTFLGSKGEFTQEKSSPTKSSVFLESNSGFRPSLVLPFLNSTEQKKLFTVVETREPKVSSFLRSEGQHFISKKPEVIALSPIRVDSSKTIDSIREPKRVADQITPNRHQSIIPVPRPVIFNSEEDEGIEPATEATIQLIPTRKTFHFEQEFLSLLKRNNPIEKSKPQNTGAFETNPFWFNGNSGTTNNIWRLKGGDRSPSLDLLSQDSIVSQVTLKNNLGGMFETSIRGLEPKSHAIDASSLKILDDHQGSASLGITVKSLAEGGLSIGHEIPVIRTTIKPLIISHNFSETSLKLGNPFNDKTPSQTTSQGPQIVPVGEVGEVTHEDTSATDNPVPSLSGNLKHGVQSINVTTWISRCPKLYGKAQLNCVIEHDSNSNTAMTMMWKKKSFTEGRPQEHVMTENDLLKMDDERYSLSHVDGQYVLSIKDFRPKDCGTYECEAKAADITAASQLLLFTCH